MQSIQQDVLQFSCLYKNSNKSSYLVTSVSLALIPFLLGALGYIFWKILSKIVPNQFGSTYKRNSITTAFVFAYISWPTINSYAF